MKLSSLLRSCTIILILILFFIMPAYASGQTATEQGYYTVNMDFTSNPVKVGSNTMELMIHDVKTGRPVENKLKIEVVPWMPAHEHITRDVPVVSKMSDGKYLIENINFSMPGDWEVYVKIIDGSKEDTVVFNVAVSK